MLLLYKYKASSNVCGSDSTLVPVLDAWVNVWIKILTFYWFKHLSKQSRSTSASVSHYDQVDLVVLNGLGQDVEYLHVHDHEVGGQPELGDVHEGALIWAVDIFTGVSDNKEDISTILTNTK